MADRLDVLLVEDSPDDAALILRELRRGGFEPDVHRVETAEAMRAALAERDWHVVLADYSLPRFSGLAALEVLRAERRDVPFIVVTGAISDDTAVAAMRAGAHDYVMKENLRRLVPAIRRELREAADRRERAATEASLARERDQSRTLLEESSAMIVGLDAEARVTLFNRAAEALTGYSREEVLGKGWFDLFLPADRVAEVAAVWTRFRETGQPSDYENPIVTATGEERLIAWRNSVIRAGDRVAGALCFGVDVTARQRAEEERAALELLARRAERLAALGTLAAGLAHELNNPIGIISSRIELMLMESGEGGLPAATVADLQVLHRHAQRIARVTQGLLSFARNAPGDRLGVDLNQVVHDLDLLAGKEVTRSGVELALDLAPGLPQVQADASALQQVLLNLVLNARDAIQGAGRIVIATRSSPGPPAAVLLTVSDTGCGIAPQHLARIFDPFFTTKRRGTGLGLAITHGIVRDHGATIDVESRPGRGARFTITFPAQPA